MKMLLKQFGLPIAVLLALSFPLYITDYYIEVLTLVFINVILIQSLNVLTGYAGQISLGQAGLFAVGAYGSAVLMLEFSLPFVVAVPAGILLAAAVGLLLSFPARRVTEFYLAVVTLGFGAIVGVVVREWPLLGGFSGLSLIPSPITATLTIFGFTVSSESYYYIVLIAMVLATLLLRNLVRSHVGRAFLATRENEIAALSTGINPGRTKQLAYMVSGSLAGLAGTLYAHYISYLGYEQFSILRSVEVLAMTLVGGLGSLVGPFIGGIFQTWAPQVLQPLGEYQLLVYGLLLILIIRYYPRGLAGLLQAKDSYVNVPGDEIQKLKEAEYDSTGENGELNYNHPLSTTLGQETESRDSDYEGQSAIIIEDVTKNFDSLKALDNVSMVIKRGEVHGLVGPNGSGKSTLVNIVTGAYPATSGSVVYEGERVDGQGMDQTAKKGIVRIFQDPRLIPEATVLENVLLGAQGKIKTGFWSALSGHFNKRAELNWAMKSFDSLGICGIRAHGEELTESLPYGTSRLVEIARAITADPSVLILDEPAAGLSDEEISTLAQLLHRLKRAGITVIVIEHNMEFISNVVDRVTVLDSGRVIYEGSPAKMQADSNVAEAYLGAT